MRVLLMMSGLAMGGAERNIISVLPHIKAAGVDIRLCTMNTRRDSPLTEEFVKSGVERIDLRAKRMTDLSAWQQFIRTIRDENIDLVHSQDQDTNIYNATARWRLGIPNLMTRHVLKEPMDTFKEAARARMVLFAARFGLQHVLAVSEAVRQQFSELAHVPISKITTVYNGIELERFRTWEQRTAKRAEMGWDPNAPIVVMVAVLRRGKGHEVLFEAIPRITAAVPNAQIKLVGSGELEEQLKTLAEPYGDTVEFLGQRMDVPELLGASDALVLPSWSEALPTVLIEAGAAALPLVATDVGGSAEIVEDGRTGYIVQPGDMEALADRLIALLKQPQAARDMGQRAYERVIRIFSLQAQAEQTAALYERILRAQ